MAKSVAKNQGEEERVSTAFFVGGSDIVLIIKPTIVV